ncbi:MAG: WD40 repeat domain-containing protein, partial [Actinobacteria bacterium]|nr:WD40 repeat domain-containing protein [Actinomycetota bacterium]
AEAMSLALASASSSLLHSRPDVSLLFALEANRTSPRPEARSSALAALTAACTPGLLAVLHGHNNALETVAFSRDRRTLASAADDQTIRLWNLRTYKQHAAPLTGHTGSGSSVAFSPDGRTLASAGDDHAIRLWDLRSHKQLSVPLTGHTSDVYGLAFNRDGRTLASGSDDQTIRFWDVSTHKPLGTPLTGHAGAVGNVAFSPDGRTLASARADKTIRVWEKILWRNFAELKVEVCKLVGNGLNKTEWAQYAAGIPHQSCP